MGITARWFRRGLPHTDVVIEPEVGGSVIIRNGSKTDYEVLTAATVLTAADSGKTLFLGTASGFQVTLPVMAAGMNFKFVVQVAPTTSGGYPIVAHSTQQASIFGLVLASPTDDAGVLAADEDNITIVHDQAIIGDYVEFLSDGTKWYVSGMVNKLEAVTANS